MRRCLAQPTNPPFGARERRRVYFKLLRFGEEGSCSFKSGDIRSMPQLSLHVTANDCSGRNEISILLQKVWPGLEHEDGLESCIPIEI